MGRPGKSGKYAARPRDSDQTIRDDATFLAGQTGYLLANVIMDEAWSRIFMLLEVGVGAFPLPSGRASAPFFCASSSFSVAF